MHVHLIGGSKLRLSVASILSNLILQIMPLSLTSMCTRQVWPPHSAGQCSYQNYHQTWLPAVACQGQGTAGVQTACQGRRAQMLAC